MAMTRSDHDCLVNIPEPPHPAIVLYGCRPLVPHHPRAPLEPDGSGYPRYRAGPTRPLRPGADTNFPAGHCPTCKGLIGQHEDDHDHDHGAASTTYCELCGAMAPRHERLALAGRIGTLCRLRSEQAEQRAWLALRARARQGLTDSDRCRIALGYRAYFGETWHLLVNPSWLGRRFLTELDGRTNPGSFDRALPAVPA